MLRQKEVLAQVVIVTAAAISIPLSGSAASAQTAADKGQTASSSVSRNADPDPVRVSDTPAEEPQQADIIVTAQRREQSIGRVGIAITAISGGDLAKLGVQTTQGMAAHVPSLQFDGGNSGGLNAFVTIRGVSQVDSSEHQEAPNAVYLDDVYVPTPSMVGFQVYDLQRAEALRGPQGTLFGRNSTGGLLQFITADPTKELSGFADISYANYATLRAEGAVGGPITENVGFRIAGFADHGDGFFKNTLPGGHDTFETRSYGVRGKLAINAGDWTVKLIGSYNTSPRHREGTYKTLPSYYDSNGTAQFVPADVDIYETGAGNDPFGYRDRDKAFDEGAFNNVGFLSKDYYYGTAKIEGPVGAATLTSVTNYSRGDVAYQEDSDGTPNDVYVFGSGGRTRQVSQELRLSGDAGRLHWTAGAYFLDLEGTYYIDSDLRPLTAKIQQGPFHSREDYTQHTRSYAGFGQIEYAIADTLKFTLGGRYTHDRKIFASLVTDITSGSPVVLGEFDRKTVGDAALLSRGDWAGKIQVDYTGINSLLLYASASRGIRGGGFNSNVYGLVSDRTRPFKNETVIAYESGAKLQFANGRGHLFLSGFYYDYSGYQAYNYIGIAVSVSNNDAYFYGGEAELTFSPVRSLDVSLGGSYLQGKVKGIATPTGPEDVDPVKAPKWTFNGVVTKSFDVGPGELALQYDFNYIDHSEANLVLSPVTRLNSSWIQNGRISYALPQGLEIYGFVRNFMNEGRKTFAYDSSVFGYTTISYAPPRTYGIGVRKTF